MKNKFGIDVVRRTIYCDRIKYSNYIDKYIHYNNSFDITRNIFYDKYFGFRLLKINKIL
jgi:hypothetical protein